jgi:hypothetical protein
MHLFPKSAESERCQGGALISLLSISNPGPLFVYTHLTNELVDLDILRPSRLTELSRFSHFAAQRLKMSRGNAPEKQSSKILP